jgi:CheY-specific phosphatase CheX
MKVTMDESLAHAIAETVTLIWGTTFALPVEQDESLQEIESSDIVVAAVHVLGHWSGSVFVEAPLMVAQACARSMFSLEEEEPTEEQIESIMREICNMIGGHIKSWFDTRAVLSVPKTFCCASFRYDPPETNLRDELVFSTEGYQFLVRVFDASLDIPTPHE